MVKISVFSNTIALFRLSIGAENILFPLLKLLKLKIAPRAQCSVPTIKQTQPPPSI